MKSFCSKIAKPYLESAIGVPIRKIIESPVNFEVEPQKATQRNEDAKKNAENLMKVTYVQRK